MATITKRTCDRCGKELKFIGWTSKIKRFGILSLLNGNPSGYEYTYGEVELCRECTKKLNRFLKNNEVD